jgi:hypothetical protein
LVAWLIHLPSNLLQISQSASCTQLVQHNLLMSTLSSLGFWCGKIINKVITAEVYWINSLGAGHRYVDHWHISIVALVFVIVTSNLKICWYSFMLAIFVVQISGVFFLFG